MFSRKVIYILLLFPDRVWSPINIIMHLLCFIRSVCGELLEVSMSYIFDCFNWECSGGNQLTGNQYEEAVNKAITLAEQEAISPSSNLFEIVLEDMTVLHGDVSFNTRIGTFNILRVEACR